MRRSRGRGLPVEEETERPIDAVFQPLRGEETAKNRHVQESGHRGVGQRFGLHVQALLLGALGGRDRLFPRLFRTQEGRGSGRRSGRDNCRLRIVRTGHRRRRRLALGIAHCQTFVRDAQKDVSELRERRLLLVSRGPKNVSLGFDLCYETRNAKRSGQRRRSDRGRSLGVFVHEERRPDLVPVLEAETGQEVRVLESRNERREEIDEDLKSGDRQQIVLGPPHQPLLALGVCALFGRVQQNPVQRVQQFGLGGRQLVESAVPTAVKQSRATVHDVRQSGHNEAPSADALDGLSETRRETELDVLHEHLLEGLARLALLHGRRVLQTTDLRPNERTESTRLADIVCRQLTWSGARGTSGSGEESTRRPSPHPWSLRCGASALR